MRNIIVRADSARYEFIHTPDLGGRSSLRLRSASFPDAHWSLTAEARWSASICPHGPRHNDEAPNTCSLPDVPLVVIEQALMKAGDGASYKVW